MIWPMMAGMSAVVATGCTTVEGGSSVGPDGTRSVYSIVNFPKVRSTEGMMQEVEQQADQRMAAICAEAREGLPVVIRRVWTHPNSQVVTFRCGPLTLRPQMPVAFTVGSGARSIGRWSLLGGVTESPLQ